MTGTELLKIDGISKSYPGVKANENVSFAIGKGEVLGLVGESGAGKSTVGLAAMGYVKPGCRISGGRDRGGFPGHQTRAAACRFTELVDHNPRVVVAVGDDHVDDHPTQHERQVHIGQVRLLLPGKPQ